MIFVQIVPEDSAVVHGMVDTFSLALHKHHIDLVKYTSAGDHAFQTVADQIGDMIKNAEQKTKHNWQHEIQVQSKYQVLIDMI